VGLPDAPFGFGKAAILVNGTGFATQCHSVGLRTADHGAGIMGQTVGLKRCGWPVTASQPVYFQYRLAGQK